MYMALKPSRGQLKLFGQDVTSLTRRETALMRRRIGIVFQEFRLLEHLTAFENVTLPLRVAHQPRENYYDDVVELLNWVGLGERMHAYPATLSGGNSKE